jgi:hypothetical protein
MLGKAERLYYSVLFISYSLDKYTTVECTAAERDLGIEEVIHTLQAAHSLRPIHFILLPYCTSWQSSVVMPRVALWLFLILYR